MAHRDWRTFGNKTTASRVSRVVEAYSELSLVERAAVNQQLGLAEAAVIDELQSAIEEAAEVLTRPPYEVAEAERAAIRDEVLRELGSAGSDGVPDTVSQVTSTGEHDVAHADAPGAGQGETHGSIVAAHEDNDSVTITTDSAGDDGATAHEGDGAGSHSATRPSAEPAGEPATAGDGARAAGNGADAQDHAGDGDAREGTNVADAAADANGHGDRGLDVSERGDRERSGGSEAGAQDAPRPSAEDAGVTATSMSVAQAAPAGAGARGRTKFMDAAQRASRGAQPSAAQAEANADTTGASVATDADTDSSATASASASPFDAPVESMTYDDGDEDAVAPARFDGDEDYEFDDDFDGDELDDEDPEFAGYDLDDLPDGEDEIDVPDEAVVRE